VDIRRHETRSRTCVKARVENEELAPKKSSVSMLFTNGMISRLIEKLRQGHRFIDKKTILLH